MNIVKRFFIQLRAFAWTAFALVCISLALLVGVANLLMPYADRFRPEVEQWMAKRLNRPVSIDRLEAEWAAFGPRVYMEGLTVGKPDDKDRLEVAMANVGLDVFSWLKPGREGMQSFRVTVDQIELIRGRTGQWRLGGFGGPSGSVRSEGNPLSWLSGPSYIGFHVRDVVLRDEALDRTLLLPGGDFRFNNHGDHQHVSGWMGNALSGRVHLAAEHQVELDETRLFLEADGLSLSSWIGTEVEGLEVTDGELSFRIWGELSAESRQWYGDVSVQELEIEATTANSFQGTYRLAALNAGIGAWFDDRSRGLRLESLQLSRGGSSWRSRELALAVDGKDHRLVADRLRLQDFTEALVMMPLLPDEVRRKIAESNPQGFARDVDLRVKRVERGSLVYGRTVFDQLSWLGIGNSPSARDIHATVDFHGRTADIDIHSDSTTLAFGDWFRAPFDEVTLDGRAGADWRGRQPVITLNELKLRHLDAEATVVGRVRLNGKRPFMDLAARISGGRLPDARHYWPIRKLPESLVSWLDRALEAGRVTEGSMVLFGDLDDWPFENGEGRWETRVRIQDATLAYRPDWPPIEGMETLLHLDSIGLSADVIDGTVSGVDISGAEVELPRYRAPILTVQAEGSGTGNDLLELLRRSPLQADYGHYLSELTVDGPGDVWLNLELPLTPELGDLQATGHVWLDQARIEDGKWDVVFDRTTGRVDYSEAGFEAVDLDTVFRGTPGQLSVRSGDFVDDPTIVGEGILRATSNPEVLLEDFETLMPLSAYISGETPWQARIVMPAAEGAPPRFQLACQLAPADVQLPPPLSKPSGPSMPFRLSFDLAEPLTEFHMAIGDIGTLKAIRAPETGIWSGILKFGPGDVPRPQEAGLAVTGDVPYVDLDAWMGLANRLGLFTPPEEGAQPILNSLDLHVDSLMLAARRIDDLDIDAYQKGDYWYVDLRGPRIDGQLRLPPKLDENRLLLAEFDRLEWPDREGEREAPDAGVDPRNYPPLDFYAADLKMGDAELGAVRFESFPTETGMRIDNFETESPHFELMASGEWLSVGASRFDVTLTAEDLGEALESFGFTGMVEDGQLLAKLEAEWPGAPSDFELAGLSGQLELSVGKGQISEVDPGAGRIFGLLSLQALPRRLLLDFSDLFKSGLAFDRISGHFELDDGQAYTDDLTIEGPTANVHIQGRTNLATRDYDQVITVVPKVSDALPLVGAIAGGGVGAAAVLLLENVFSSQIDRISQYHYSVTGPWEKPDIELIGANQSELDVERLQPTKEG